MTDPTTYRQRPMMYDPRPDLAGDHVLWERFLAVADLALRDDQTTLSLLHGLRCMGAGMEETGAGVRIVRGEMEQAEYAAWREKWLMPRAKEVCDVLAAFWQTKDRA